MGTPEYIAPEQARDSHTSDIRADLYSLVVRFITYSLANRRFPNGTMTEKLLQHQQAPPPSVELIRREKMKAATADVDILRVPAAVDDLMRRC